jgi:hypothetical protein
MLILLTLFTLFCISFMIVFLYLTIDAIDGCEVFVDKRPVIWSIILFILTFLLSIGSMLLLTYFAC